MNYSLGNYKNIFWDFDGVILNSMPIRDIGFVEIFKEFDKDAVNQLLAFHKKNGGWSRYVKIEHFFKNILNIEYNNDDILKYANKFSIIMKKKLVNRSLLIEDSLNFIKANYQNKQFHIVSGSDQNELRYLCEKMSISKYFRTINGSPTIKDKLVNNLLTEYNFEKQDTCLIGDSINDYDAAKLNGIRFFGYNNPSLSRLDCYIKSFT